MLCRYDDVEPVGAEPDGGGRSFVDCVLDVSDEGDGDGCSKRCMPRGSTVTVRKGRASFRKLEVDALHRVVSRSISI